jgi:hypothetical protein
MILNILAVLILVIFIPLAMGLPSSIFPNPRSYNQDERFFVYWLNGVGIILFITFIAASFFGLIWCFFRVAGMFS